MRGQRIFELTYPALFWIKVESGKADDECWLWEGERVSPGEYGRLHFKGQNYYAHRLAYELEKGSIPDRMEVDHLCNVRLCVNPAHLEAVTHAENTTRTTERGRHHNTLKTHCIYGHEFDGDNTYITSKGERQCRACHRRRDRLRRKERS